MYKVLLYNHRTGFEQDFPTEASRTLYDDMAHDDLRQIFEPHVQDSITEIPSFEFSILPNHPLYNELSKFKTTITVYRNTRVLFYGRVMNDSMDFYGRRQVSCEGALGFLLDTCCPPANMIPTIPTDMLEMLVNEHNKYVNSGGDKAEPWKAFTIGTITASKVKDGTEYPVSDEHLAKKFKYDGYNQTKAIIDDQLVNDFKGFMHARYENGKLYLDWLKSFARINDQPIKMTVNLLDRTYEENTDDYYTVMLPIGANNRTIAGVNDGSLYLEDEAAIAKHGRIIKPETFGDIRDAAKLKEKALEEFSKRGSDLPASWRIKAVDMYLLGKDVMDVRAGDKLTNLEDRTGNLIDNVTVVEGSYYLLDPSQDEYTLENQTAIDQRNMGDRGDGTLSGRAGGMSGAFDGDTRNFRGSFDTYQLTVSDWYDLTANSITERSQEHNIITGILNAMYDDGYFDAFTGNNIQEITIKKEDGTEETAYVQAMSGSRIHQSSGEVTTYVQDITGIRMERIQVPNQEQLPEGAEYASEFSERNSYKKDDYVYLTVGGVQKLYKFKVDHPAGKAWTAEEVEAVEIEPVYSYVPMYKKDSQGNDIYDLITGEAVYDTIDNAEANKVHIPLRTIAQQTQKDFYQMVGTTDIERVLAPEDAVGATDFDPNRSYAIGDYCYWTNQDGERGLYQFTSAHMGAWTGSDANAVMIQTIQRMVGSHLWQQEEEIVNVVGEIEVQDIVPPQASDATKFSENSSYSPGDYVWYPPEGENRGLYEFTGYHSGPWTGTDVKQITTRTMTIKNGTGLQVIKDGAALGIFKDGMIDAGFIIDSLNNGDTSAKIKASRLEVDTPEIVFTRDTLINVLNGEGELKIKAAVVEVDGKLITDTVEAAVADFLEAGALDIQANTITADTELTVGEGAQMFVDGYASFSNTVNFSGDVGIYVDGDRIDVGATLASISDLPTAINSISLTPSTSQSGATTYTLSYTTTSNSTPQVVGSFSRATQLSGAWSSGGKYTVTANDDAVPALPLSLGLTPVAGSDGAFSVKLYEFTSSDDPTQQAERMSYPLKLHCSDDYCYVTDRNDRTLVQIPNTKPGSDDVIVEIDSTWSVDDDDHIFKQVRKRIGTTTSHVDYIYMPDVTVTVTPTYDKATHTYKISGTATYSDVIVGGTPASANTTGTEAYEDGWKAAAGSTYSYMPPALSGSSTAASGSFSWPSTAVVGSGSSKTLTLSYDANYISLSDGTNTYLRIAMPSGSSNIAQGSWYYSNGYKKDITTGSGDNAVTLLTVNAPAISLAFSDYYNDTGLFSVFAQGPSVNGSTPYTLATKNIQLSCDDSWCKAEVGSTLLARIPNTKSAEGSVTWPNSSVSNAQMTITANVGTTPQIRSYAPDANGDYIWIKGTAPASLSGAVYARIPNTTVGMGTVTISGPMSQEPSAQNTLGTINADSWYTITATPKNGDPKVYKLRTAPGTGGTAGIASLSQPASQSSEPTADVNGGTLSSSNTWYLVTATPNSGTAKTLKFKTPSSTGGIKSLVLNGPSTGPYNYGDDKGTLTSGRYYQVVATPNTGDPEIIKFHVPASSSGTTYSEYRVRHVWQDYKPGTSYSRRTMELYADGKNASGKWVNLAYTSFAVSASYQTAETGGKELIIN